MWTDPLDAFGAFSMFGMVAAKELDEAVACESCEESIEGFAYHDDYLSRCRHECTNYDLLIDGLSKDDVEDRIRYQVIREHIDELLTDHENYQHLDGEE